MGGGVITELVALNVIERTKRGAREKERPEALLFRKKKEISREGGGKNERENKKPKKGGKKR